MIPIQNSGAANSAQTAPTPALTHDEWETPAGTFLGARLGAKLAFTALGVDAREIFAHWLKKNGRTSLPRRDAPLRRAVAAYFRGEADAFKPIEVTFLTGTPFQRRVWKQLLKTPFGRVLTYGELAVSVGVPRAPRAIGQAMRRNPIPLVVPCHRVVAGSRRLGGFSCGLDIKKQLLAAEGWKISADRIAPRPRKSTTPA
jgi:O-6-methylguanine DNA methyltransferase